MDSTDPKGSSTIATGEADRDRIGGGTDGVATAASSSPTSSQSKEMNVSVLSPDGGTVEGGVSTSTATTSAEGDSTDGVSIFTGAESLSIQTRRRFPSEVLDTEKGSRKPL